MIINLDLQLHKKYLIPRKRVFGLQIELNVSLKITNNQRKMIRKYMKSIRIKDILSMIKQIQ